MKNVSIVSVAERLGISASEVSRAFKEGHPMKPEKRALIKRTAAEMGYVRNEAASRLTMKPIKLAFIASDDFPEFDNEIRHGAKEAGRTYHAYKLMIDYKPFRASCCPDPVGEFDKLLDSCVSESFDAVIIEVCFDGVEGVIKKYAGKIKIALVNFDLPASGRLFAVVNNAASVASIAAQLLSKSAQNGKCAVFAGAAGHYTHQRIVEFFSAEARVRGFDIACIYNAVSEAELKRQVEEAFAAHSDITAIYATSAISVPICEYIEKNGLCGKVTVITSDIYKRLNKYISDGTVSATMYQNPSWQAFTAVETMFKAIAYGAPFGERIVAKPEIVIAANLNLYYFEA